MKIIEEKKTNMKVKYKVFIVFTMIKLNPKFEKRDLKEKEKFVDWSKDKKCVCKYLADKKCKHINNKCDKYFKTALFLFYNSYISFNKEEM